INRPNGIGLISCLPIIDTAKFGRQIYATKNQLDACWSFPANTPKGIYHIRVGVGGAEFGTQSFKIVN
ncbi:MAG: hypothetical protein Q4D68_05900, partial [Moraxella equi]|nr:hypothetical protein [Moraxella equi]